jgi:sugar lactone lactonase YvrE
LVLLNVPHRKIELVLTYSRQTPRTEEKSHFPSGVALSPDQAMLIVSDGQAKFSWSFQIAADERG